MVGQVSTWMGVRSGTPDGLGNQRVGKEEREESERGEWEGRVRGESEGERGEKEGESK